MYLTDTSRFLISCVIQHYASVVGWGGGEEQVHNVEYDPVPAMTLLKGPKHEIFESGFFTQIRGLW
jgi:hypothetical protein